MITTKKIADKYYDVTDTATGRSLGSFAKGYDESFRWFPFLSAAPVLEAATLRSIADFLDTINPEATKADASAPTVTD